MASRNAGRDQCLGGRGRCTAVSADGWRICTINGQVNWEWVGSLHGDSSAFPLGSNERWTTATAATARALQPGEDTAAAASSSSDSHPPYHPLRVEAGTPEEGGLLPPHSATATTGRAVTASSPYLQSPSSTASFADVSTASAAIPEIAMTTATTAGVPVMLHSGSYIPATNEPSASGMPLSYGHNGPVAYQPASTPVAMAEPGGIPMAALASSQSAAELGQQPALKEKRSLGKRLTRRFHKLTHHHHHHHEDPQQQ